MRAADPLIALVLFASAFAVGDAYFKAFTVTGAKASFGQGEMGAAVALACGHGFVNPGYALSPQFTDFLAERRDDVACAEFPAVTAAKLTFTQGLYRYLHMAIGAIWWWQGVSWAALAPLAGLLFAASTTLAFFLFRLGMGPVLAAAGAVLMGTSAIQLGNLPYLRDYAKTPFMLALLIVMGLIVKREVTARSLVTLGAGFGLVLGIGFGFRNDMLITVVPFAASVWLFLPGGVTAHLKLKAIASAAMALTFLVVASPILLAYSGGSNSGHVAVLGLMSAFDASIGIARSVYEWGHAYMDGYAASIVTSYAQRAGHGAVEYLSPAYEQFAVRYLLDVAQQYPADMLTRGFASLIRVLDVPFSFGVYTNPIPHGVTDPSIVAAYQRVGEALAPVNETGLSVAMALGALAVIGVRSVRLAAFVFLVAAYFGAYPAVQFAGRHLFYLEFVTIWTAGCLLSGLLGATGRSLRALWQPAARARIFSAAGARGGALVVGRFVAVPAVIAVLCFGAVTAARAYQRPRVERMFESILAAPKESLAIEAAPSANGLVLHRTPGFSEAHAEVGEVQTHYLVAELGGGDCQTMSVAITIRYLPKTPANDYSETLVVPFGVDGGVTRVVFPVYNTQWTRFEGIQMPAAAASCLDGISRFLRPEQFPVLVTAVLPPDWRTRRLYQAIQAWEGRELPLIGMPPIYPVDPHLQLPRGALSATGGLRQVADSLAPIVTAAPTGAWLIAGTPATPNTYLVSFPPTAQTRDALLVVRGTIRRGGLSVGILRGEDGAWAGVANVPVPGPFIVVMRAPADGSYVPVVADFAPDSLPGRTGTPRVTDATIERVAWWSDPKSRQGLQ